MEVTCDCCNIKFNKNPNQIKTTKANYCSRSCSAKINNKKYKKRKLEGKCVICSEPISASRVHCTACRLSKTKVNKFESWLSEVELTKKPIPIKDRPHNFRYETVGDIMRGHLEKYGRIRSNTFSTIRGRARIVAEKELPRACQNCGYDKHVEVCHKRPISSFDPSASIDNEINHIDNLCVLCPNCHWEFDHSSPTKV